MPELVDDGKENRVERMIVFIEIKRMGDIRWVL